MYKNASYIPLMRFGLLLLGLLSCFWFLACDPERKKKCEWTLEPELTPKEGRVEPGFIPVCARNWVSHKQDCQLASTLPFAKEIAGKKFRYVDMKVESLPVPRKIEEIQFCDGNQKISISSIMPLDSTPPPRTPIVQPKWKNTILALFASSPTYTKGWALLSSGGWADSGQYFVLQKNGKVPAVLYYAPPGATAWSETQPISPTQWQVFQKAMEQAQSLTPFFSQVFDGVEYEFFTLTKEGGKTQTRGVYMNNPGAFPEKAAPYNQLVEHFLRLVQKKKL